MGKCDPLMTRFPFGLYSPGKCCRDKVSGGTFYWLISSFLQSGSQDDTLQHDAYLKTDPATFIATFKLLALKRASLCKILISSFAQEIDFAHNFSVDFFK